MKHRNFLRFTGSLLVATVFMALAACGGGSGGSNNTAAVVPVCVAGTICQNGQPVVGTPIFTAESVDAYQVLRFSWIFSNPTMGQTGYPQYQNGYQQYQGYPQPYQQYQGGYQGYQQYQGYQSGYQGYNSGYGYAQTASNYNGPIITTGTLNIAQVLNLGYCQIPAGSYSLNTIAPGNWSGQFVSNVRMQAIGPASINLTLTQGQIASQGYLQYGQPSTASASSGRIFANVTIDSVNGAGCQMSVIVQ